MTSFATNPKVLIGIGVLAAVASWFMLIRPQSTELAAVKADHKAAETQLARATTPTTTSKAAAAAAAAAASNRKTVEAAVPPEIRLAEVLRQLDSVSRSAGVRQSTVTPAETSALPAGSTGSYAQITVAATGSRAAIESYLQQLTTIDRLFVAEQVAVQDVAAQQPAGAAPAAGSPTTPSGEVQLQLTGRVLSTAVIASATPGSKTGSGSTASTTK